MATRRNACEISVRMVRLLHSTPAEVFAAWIEPELFAGWLTDDSDTISAFTLDARKGGGFRLEGLHSDGTQFSFKGTYLQIIKGRRVSFSWEYDGPNRVMCNGPSVVIADFRRLAEGATELSITHRLLAKQKQEKRASARPLEARKKARQSHGLRLVIDSG